MHNYYGFPQTTELIAELVNVRSTSGSDSENDSLEDEQLSDAEYEQAYYVDDVGEGKMVQNKVVAARVNDYYEDVCTLCTERVKDSTNTEECVALFSNVHIVPPEDIHKRRKRWKSKSNVLNRHHQ